MTHAEHPWHGTAQHGTASRSSPWGTSQSRALAPASAGKKRQACVNPGIRAPLAYMGLFPLPIPRGTQALTLVEMMVQRSSVSSPSSSARSLPW